MAIADRMPELGRKFFEQGPARGIARLSTYFHEQIAAGKLRIDDVELAASQFMDACQSTLFKPMIFNFAPPPSEEQIAHVVRTAVRTFLAAYKKCDALYRSGAFEAAKRQIRNINAVFR